MVFHSHSDLGVAIAWQIDQPLSVFAQGKEINQLGGDVCQQSLPELRVGEFVADEIEAAKRRESVVTAFDPEI